MEDQNFLEAKKKALKLFHKAYKKVPAYKKFVDAVGVNPKKIKTLDDFEKIPVMDKDSYINEYPLEERIIKSSLSDFYWISASSGTSNNPTLWPRDFKIDKKIEKLKEKMYEDHFQISKQKSLCCITFLLGMWVGGMLTFKLSLPINKKHKFSIVTPGMDANNTLSILKGLSERYDQTIILGYPPFLIDFIENAVKDGFDFKKINTKIMCTGERFNEYMRNNLTKLISRTGTRHDIVIFYGCSETGIVGCETNFAIDVLGEVVENKKLCQDLFNSKEVPSLVSYNPRAKFLEEIDHELLITADQPCPLIRFNIHDRGGLISKDYMVDVLNHNRFVFDEKSVDNYYVYLYGRSDSVSIGGANTYIDDLKFCFDHSKYKHKLTRKFKFGKIDSEDGNFKIRVIVYLKKGEILELDAQEKFEEEFYQNLMEASADFKAVHHNAPLERFIFEYQDENQAIYSTKFKYLL